MGPRTNEKVLYLTYDDGPMPGPTDQILAELRAQDVKATFFVLGRQVAQHPQYIRKIVDDGHLIANHTYDHRNLVYSKPTAIRTQLTRTANLVGADMGPCMRPPGGMIDRQAARQITSLGIVPVLWTGHNQDWAPPPKRKMIEMLKQATGPGAIILLHDTSTKSGTVDVTRQMIPWWKAQGYRFETIPACRQPSGR
jgi:peptidoglycan/xylan/chitin deacetylase (PgdA/CDA1 family)